MILIKKPAEELKELLAVLLPPENIYVPQVPLQNQLNQLAKINDETGHETFYFLFNLLTCELENVVGTEKCLGFADKSFNLVQYLNCIHPAQGIQHNMIAHNMYKILCSGKFKLHFSTQRYMSLIGLKPNHGEFVMFKKTTSVYQYDDKNRLLAQLNVFDKIDLYENSPLAPRITELEGLQRIDFEQMVYKMVLQNFMAKKYFSEREFEVLQKYASNEKITAKDLSGLLTVEKKTVATFNKRILTKARNTFTHSFNTARDVAVFLKKEKLL